MQQPGSIPSSWFDVLGTFRTTEMLAVRDQLAAVGIKPADATPAQVRAAKQWADALRPFIRFAQGSGFDKLPLDFALSLGSRMAGQQITVGHLRELSRVASDDHTGGDSGSHP